jgi:hypothetical protein
MELNVGMKTIKVPKEKLENAHDFMDVSKSFFYD